jgi:stalled ribosome rescue protein Dom34
MGSGHAAADHDYLQAVAEAVADARAVLITGPANAKTELLKHIRERDAKVADTIVGVETVDHPSDGQLIVHAKKYFKAADRMLPQRS